MRRNTLGPTDLFGKKTPENPFRSGSRIGSQYELMLRPNGASVKEIMEITGCNKGRVRAAVSEIRARIGEECVITHSYAQNSTKTRYEIRMTLSKEKLADDNNTNSWEQKKIAALRSVSAVKEIVSEIKHIPGRDFAQVDYHGSKAAVSLNLGHKYIDQLKGNQDKIKVLEGIAVAFDLSQKFISEDETSEGQHALERFRSEFSRQLKNLLH